jgi:hypothetical protein
MAIASTLVFTLKSVISKFQGFSRITVIGLHRNKKGSGKEIARRIRMAVLTVFAARAMTRFQLANRCGLLPCRCDLFDSTACNAI